MSLTVERIKEMFAPLAGEGGSFLENVAEDVKWTLVNPDHDLKPFGLYTNRDEFAKKVLKPVGERIQGGLKLKIIHTPIIDGQRAVVEMKAVDSKGGAPMTTNGIVFDNRYSWSIEVSPQTGKIIEIRAYLDSNMIRKTLELE